MGELGERYYKGELLVIPARVADINLDEEFRAQARNPMGNPEIDVPVTGAFWSAMIDVCQDDDGIIAKTVAEVAKLRGKNPEATASYIAGVIRTSFWAYLQESDPSFDIQRLTTKKSWMKPLSQVAEALREEELGPGSQASENLGLNLWTRQVQTNIPSRYTPGELLLQITRERFPYRVDAADIGCGIMLGPLAMMDEQARRQLRFRQVTHPYPTYIQERRKPTENANSLLDRPSILNGYACVDLEKVYNNKRGVYNNGVIEWSKASRRPSEANDPLIDRLTANLPPEISFYQGDLSKASDFIKFMELRGNKKFDFISLIATIHQMRSMPKTALVNNLVDALTPNGIAYIGEFAALSEPAEPRTTPFEITDLEIVGDWFVPGSFKGFMFDNAKPRRWRGWEHIFTFKDSRCAEFSIQMAKIVMNGELVPLHEAARLMA